MTVMTAQEKIELMEECQRFEHETDRVLKAAAWEIHYPEDTADGEPSE